MTGRILRGVFAALLLFVQSVAALAQDPPVTFTPTADAYVLDGSWANSNFGSDTWLYTRTSKGQNYDSFLKFDTSGVGSVFAAKLRFNASVSANANIAVAAHAVAETGWSESAITWNNKPARGAALGTTTVTGTAFAYYEIDVTSYVAAEKAAGRHVVSFGLHNGQTSNQYVWMRSREAGASPPQLVITPHVTPVSLLPALSTVTLGATTTLTLTISSPQATDTVVPIAESPAGIVAVPAQVTVPAGQTTVAVPVATLAYGQAGVTASLNGASASAGVNVVPPPVAVTALEPASFVMTVGATSSFTVRINAAQVGDTEVALLASNPAVLQVPGSVIVPQGATSAVFNVTGLAVGDSTLTASANGTSKVSSVHVSPEPAAIVSLLPTPLPLQQGATGALTVTINVAQEVPTTIALTNSAPEVAGVPESVLIAAGAVSAQIAVSALTPGSATVTATVNGTSASSTIDVTPPPPVVTTLTPEFLSLPKGTPGTMRVTVSRAPNAATPVALVSSDPAVASVPPQVNIPAGALFADFPVMANAQGLATITASLNGGSASASVTIGPAELVSLALTPQAPSAYVGETVAFTATGTMTDGTSEDFTSRVTWSSSASAVATINAAGVASATAAGQTTIRAAFTFTAVQTGQPVTIEQSTELTVKALLPLVLAAPTTTPTEGDAVTVTMTTSDPAPAGGLIVNLAGGGNGAGTFPATVTIPGGQTSATFQFVATAAGSYTLTATAQNRLPGAITFSIQPLLSITSISPTSGEVGASITLSGAGFDPVAANNQLTFRGINNTTVTTSALTASPTQLTVRVPPLADTGPITLTNSRGTVQSPTLTVTREQDFQLVVSPAALTVYQGSSAAAQAQLSSTGTKAFTGLVTLSVQGLPAGITASFAPAATLSAFQAGTITLTATGGAAPGNYPLTVQATFSEGGAAFVRSSTVTLNVAAATGVTGVKGRFVTPEGQGIAGVIVRADIATNPQPQTVTDAAGNFVLTGLPAAAVTLRFDATPANPLYPIWPYTSTVAANQVSVLSDFTINPPPSDDKFTTINNATQAQTITDPRYPGLEVKLPAGVTITGWDGVVKTRIAVERITPDRLPVSTPPFPMREAYQLFFGTPMGGIPSAPIPITLPNVAEAEPDTLLDVWFFDGSPMGGTGEWRVAGQGRVSADGKTVSMLPGQGITRFCGVCGLVSVSCPPPPNPPPPGGGGCRAGKPVDLFSGLELPSTGGLSCGGLTPIDTGLNYHPVDAFNNRAGTVGSFGFGWVSDYDIAFLPFSGPQKRLVMPGSRLVNFVDDGGGNYRSFDEPRFDGAVIRAINEAANEWELTFKNGGKWRFKPFAGVTGVIRGGPPTFVTEMVDSAGNGLSIARQSNGRITSVGSQNRNVVMTYGANGFVSEVRDSANRVMRYTYTTTNRIRTITDADDKVTSYTYVGDDEVPADAACAAALGTHGERIKTIHYPGRLNPITNFHGVSRRVLRQVAHDGRETRFAYKVTGACVTHANAPGVKCTANCPDVDSHENFDAGWRIHGGQVVATTVTLPDGKTYTHNFNPKGWAQQTVDANGQRTRNKFDSANRLIERTDVIGRTWKYQYDAEGNITQEVDPLNRVVNYTYDPKWNKVNSITRFLEDNTAIVVRFAFDPATGNPIRTTDPLNSITSYAYTSRGQLGALTMPGNRTSTFEYNAAGDLVKSIDPLGNERLFQTDGAGRVVTFTDPLGFDTRTEYNGVNQITKVIDPLLQESRITYDAAQRPASVIDPRNIAIRSYQYDSGDRVTTATDALKNSETAEYDSAGRPSRITDRKGHVTTFEYDQAGRIARTVFPDATRTYSYDALGRLVEIREGSNTVTYGYDTLDRIVNVITDSPAGRHDVGYQYDALDRVTRRTVNGADPTVYTYDNASRLTSIGYRNQLTTYERDASGRLASKTLPNGIKQLFVYDDADRVLSITYKNPDDSVIETITYSYDAKGQRLTKSWGSASVGETPFTATYDAANRMTGITLGGTNQSFTLIYDDNGNLISKTDTANPANVTTYTWDSRNRLTAISGPGIEARFSYDALGRRTEKTVNGQTIGFVYDGAQAIGEVTGGTISTTLLTGLAIDEVLARYSQTGSRTYLTDALRSVIAQTKDDQSVQNFYGYSAYGESQSLGADEGNPIQYTGRENDATGLLYYRARYYDPVLKRFISEDPIGLAAGPNVYAYVNGDPINMIDPTGNVSTCYSAGPNCSGAGPGNYPGNSIIKTPPNGECLKAVWRGGYIVGWEPCTPPCPPDPTPPPGGTPPGTPSGTPGGTPGTTGTPGSAGPSSGSSGTRANWDGTFPWHLSEPNFEDYAWCLYRETVGGILLELTNEALTEAAKSTGTKILGKTVGAVSMFETAGHIGGCLGNPRHGVTN